MNRLNRMRDTQRYHPLIRRPYLAALSLVTLCLTLAGCGYSSTSALGPGTGSGAASPSAVHGTTARPCDGPDAGVSVEGQPALVLTDATSNHTGAAPVGGLVQVQLQATWRWGLGPISSNLSATPYVGAFDQARRVCFWNFHALSAGTAKIDIIGTALCESGQPCSMIAQAETFTVQVS